MTSESGSTDFNDPFYEYLYEPPSVTLALEDILRSIPVLGLPPTLPDLTHLYEPLESPSDMRSGQEVTLNSPTPHYDSASSIPSPRIIHPVNDGARPCTIYSAPIPPLPPAPTSSQTATSRPSDWRKIPQKVYGYGKKQWDFRPSEPILFHVNGRPGVNMGDAFRKKFTGLDGRDDLMLQLAGDAFSCRLWFPGYPLNSSPQVFTKYWNKDRDPIERSTLAYRVARKLKCYLDSMASPHPMDGITPRHWEIGEGFMHLDNMFLVQLEPVSKGSFQPEIWVMDRTMNTASA